MNSTRLRKLTYSALYMAIALILPFVTGQIPEIGAMLCPMHIPALLCGFMCGWPWGVAVGFISPLLRSVMFGMPAMFPAAIAMAFELAAYGLVIGLLYFHARRNNLLSVYISMLVAMIAGRAVWGIVQMVVLGLSGFTWKMFLAGAFLNAIPGIILQLILIPAIMAVLDRTGLVPFGPENTVEKS